MGMGSYIKTHVLHRSRSWQRWRERVVCYKRPRTSVSDFGTCEISQRFL